jgi:hypothetical protein
VAGDIQRPEKFEHNLGRKREKRMKTPFERWQNNIKVGLKDTGLQGVDWSTLGQDMDKCTHSN